MMAKINERPLIFPYSNPTTRSECTAEDAYRHSGGRAIFASGSPFPPVDFQGRKLIPGQGNNVYIFPAMGMAIFATEAVRVTDGMFIVAAKAVAEQVTAENLASGLIYPPQSQILAVVLARGRKSRGIYLRARTRTSASARRHRCADPDSRLQTRVWGGRHQNSMIPRFNPIIAAWVRSLAPSLDRMLRTCPLTVSTLKVR